MDERRFADINPSRVVVACYPNGPFRIDSIWARRFVGVKVGDNVDGTIKVQYYGPVGDFKQSVFRKGSMK